MRSSRRLDVTYLGDGRETLTCRECGHQETQTVGGVKPGQVDPRMLEKLGRYRASPSGILGECEACTRKMRDERYPLED